MLQTTIRKKVACTGTGLHSGKQVKMTLCPAAEDTGILFSLEGDSGRILLSPKPELVVSTGLCTTLGLGEKSVATVEHLLAAISALGIDNILIEVSGAEIPIMDGSAASFVYLLHQAQIRSLNKARKVWIVRKDLNFTKDGKYIKMKPCHQYTVDYTVDFSHPVIGKQRLELAVKPQIFNAEIAKARTFGFLQQVEHLRAQGLALGGSLDNAIVLDEYSVLNREGLRFEDEFVRHKLLDFIGDMAIMGQAIRGHFEVFASGHELNNEFLRFLADNKEKYLEEVILHEPENTLDATEFPGNAELLPA